MKNVILTADVLVGAIGTVWHVVTKDILWQTLAAATLNLALLARRHLPVDSWPHGLRGLVLCVAERYGLDICGWHC